MNGIDYIVLAGILALVAVAIWAMLRRRKKGGGCHGGCSGCAAASQCPSCTAQPKP